MTRQMSTTTNANANTHISSREAALVGALTAFARRPAPVPRPKSGKPPVRRKPSSLRVTPAPPVKPLTDAKKNESRTTPTASLVHLFEQQKIAPKPDRGPQPTVKRPTVVTTNVDVVGNDEATSQAISKRQKEKENSVGNTRARTHCRVSSPDTFNSARDVLPSPRDHNLLKPELPPPRRSTSAKQKSEREPGTLSTQSTGNLTIPDTHNDHRQLLRPRTSNISTGSLPQGPSIQAAFHQLHPRRMSALTTGDSLANAIVASSLASSRATSPNKKGLETTTNNPHNHNHHYHHDTFHHNGLTTRKPSPGKPDPPAMRQTLRKDPSASGGDSSTDNTSSDPYSKHKKKRHIRKHPNKHAEGDRKRWRDAVTERERKRYEGLWAANRGLLVVSPVAATTITTSHESSTTDQHGHDDSQAVHAIVVREIWSRSRLPSHVLEQVWNLVESRGMGNLTREEFVVGLWLIDQRLKGRKLPSRVSESVWNSVRFLQGIKIRR